MQHTKLQLTRREWMAFYISGLLTNKKNNIAICS